MKNSAVIILIITLILGGAFAVPAFYPAAVAETPAGEFSGHTDDICVVCFSPDGFILASGSEDMTIKLWDVKTGKLFMTLKGHRDDINSVEFSPDGKFLVSSSCDQTIRIWDLRNGKTVRIIGRRL